MDAKFFGLNNRIGQLVKVPADQGRIVAIAVALATSSLAHLPSSALVDSSAFYGDQVHQFVSEKISEVGESVVFASKSALEYAQLFWKMRYNAAFPSGILATQSSLIERLAKTRAAQAMDITSLWAGGSVLLSEEMSLFMNKYHVEIIIIASQVSAILAIPVGANTSDSEPVTGGR